MVKVSGLMVYSASEMGRMILPLHASGAIGLTEHVSEYCAEDCRFVPQLGL